MTIPEGKLRSLDKDRRALVTVALAADGWRGESAASGRGHIRLYPADRSKPPITVSITASDRRALVNLRGDLRRAGLEGV
jgi:hypothetical protein